MGGGLSGLREKVGTDLGDLPEDCVAMIILRLSPQEICKFAELNKAFYGASLADYVWEKKLPSNYEYLVHKLFNQRPSGVSKREIFSWLSRPIRFDGGTKELWLEKTSGKMCMAISWKGLTITGIDDRRYWSHIPSEESRFNTIAYLQQMWWMEAGGEMEFNFPVGNYSLFFRLQLGKASKRRGRRVCDVDQVHGWDAKPVRFKLSTSSGQVAVSECYLKEVGNWIAYHGGDFTVGNHHLPTKIKFSMAQIDCTHTKGGLCLDSVIICPRESTESLKELQVL